MRALMVVTLFAFTGVGCSQLLLNSGLNPEDTFQQGFTATKIRKRVGEPVFIERSPQPPTTNDFQSGDFILLNAYSARPTRAALREDYRYRGFVKRLSDTGNGMLLAMTFGLGELIAFPSALVDRIGRSFEVHYFSVWYDEDELCLAVRETKSPP